MNLYIIAGCNGAGKTTASFTVLPDILNCREFVNADEVAAWLSPFQPETAAIEAGRNRVQQRVAEGGHNIEQSVIERRYIAGIRNLFEIYLPIVDDVLIYDNSEGKHELIAEKSCNSEIIVINQLKYNKFKNV